VFRTAARATPLDAERGQLTLAGGHPQAATRRLTARAGARTVARMDAQRGMARRMVIGLPEGGFDAAWERDFAAFPPAGVIVFRRDFEDPASLRRLTARLRELARPRRLFIAMDEEGGFVSQLAGHFTVPPNAMLLARGAETGDIEWVSRVTAERLRGLGVDWTFAPVADVHSEPRNPVIGPRAYGTTPLEVTAGIGAALQGFAAGGVASCLKHFPGHGDTETDSHLALPVCNATRETLERREMAPFQANIGVDAVMSAHVLYPALDPDRPATFSRRILDDLLRGTLGFQGICITDALEMKGASGGRPLAEAGRLALEAGCDLLLYAFHSEEVRRARLELAKQLVDGAIDHVRFDAARPRLAAFSVRRPEPNEEELALPLETLTPPDWEERLTGIIRRGLRVRGSNGKPGITGLAQVIEPEWPWGASLRQELEALGVEARGAPAGASGSTPHGGSGGEPPAGLTIEAIASRVPLDDASLEALQRRCEDRPTAVVAFQADAFLDSLDRAALLVSACDATPLTRSVVAQVLASHLGVPREAPRS
jgi:beta-glucosidase-like glycosyl hydrolase